MLRQGIVLKWSLTKYYSNVCSYRYGSKTEEQNADSNRSNTPKYKVVKKPPG